MKQQLRGMRSRQAVMQAALLEFSLQGYACVTVDLICNKHNLSKGMVYHYFNGKDDLFLFCVQHVFSELARALQEEMVSLPSNSLEQMIEWYYVCRQQYFQEHTQELALFQEAILSPPLHLQQAVEELRAPLKDMNRRFFSKVLECSPTPCKADRIDALRYLEAIEGVFWKMWIGFAGADALKDADNGLQQRILLGMLLHGIF